MNKAFIDFLHAVELAKIELKCSDTGAWFRGVRSSKYRLYPSLLRPKARISHNREKDIFDEFTDFDSESDEQTNSWERLVRLQHYGVPTRLLDWTEVFGVALYFAVRKLDNGDAPSPAVWVTNPFSIARLSRKNNDKTIGVFHKQSDLDYYERFLHGNQLSWLFVSPMPYRPPKLTPRIRAQKGFFTVHGSDRRPLDSIFKGQVRQIRIPKEAVIDSRRFLNLSGIDSLAMFPDYEGFARRLRDRYE